MVTKLKKTTATPTPEKAPEKAPEAVLSNSVKDSAQQIWQAGLGAFTKAQAGGTKAFEALVKEGVSFQRKTQSVAEEKISEATQKMSNMASDISSKASGQWDKLESIFEDRVSKALNKLGVPSAKDIEALIARIDALNASVQQLAPAPKTSKPAPKRAAKTALTPVAVVEAPPVPEVVPAAKPAAKRPSRKTAVKTAVAVEEQNVPA